MAVRVVVQQRNAQYWIGRKAAAHSPMPAVKLGAGVGVVRAAMT